MEKVIRKGVNFWYVVVPLLANILLGGYFTSFLINIISTKNMPKIYIAASIQISLYLSSRIGFRHPLIKKGKGQP
jgi:hypothetical protein